MPKATVLPLKISTYLASLDALEAWDIVNHAPLPPPDGNGGDGGPPSRLHTPWTVQQKKQFEQLSASGQNADISPSRALTLVHAVARPLVAPVLNMVADRSEGNTFTGFAGTAIPVDGNSTAKIELLAQWDEPIDDGINPPARVSKTQHVAEFRPDTFNQSWDLKLPPIQHEFGDTKYRKVTYVAVSTTQFLEYLDPASTSTLRLRTRSQRSRVPRTARLWMFLPRRRQRLRGHFTYSLRFAIRIRTDHASERLASESISIAPGSHRAMVNC